MTTRKCDCPVAKKTVNVSVEITTISRDKHFTESFDLHNIRDCEGLSYCGVKTAYSTGASFKWELCPFMTILNKKG